MYKIFKIYIYEEITKTVFNKYEQKCVSVYDYYTRKGFYLPNKFLAIDRTENGIDA